MKYIDKMVEAYEKETNKHLTDTQKEAIKKVLLNSKINLKGSGKNE